MNNEMYMQRCIELARNGMGNVAPNPMVGAVLVHNNTIIGEGFHGKFGEPHAEVNAVNAVGDKTLLASATLYVSLEPCSHFGKTPPCTDLIKKHKIPRVVIGSHDTNSSVKGNGIMILENAGITVTTGILEKECRELNKRFFHFQEKKMPYVILKWAQSQDGFIGDTMKGNLSISNELSRQLTHKWRSEEGAILVGTHTASLDDPSLNVRLYSGKDPIRAVIDWEGKLSTDLNLFDRKIPTLVFTRKGRTNETNLEYISIPPTGNDLENILEVLAKKNIQSLLVEGGAKLLQSFIDSELWNEARVFISDQNLGGGVVAPLLKGKVSGSERIKNDTLVEFKNDKQ